MRVLRENECTVCDQTIFSVLYVFERYREGYRLLKTAIHPQEINLAASKKPALVRLWVCFMYDFHIKP